MAWSTSALGLFLSLIVVLAQNDDSSQGCTLKAKEEPSNLPLITAGNEIIYQQNAGGRDIILPYGQRTNFSCAPLNAQLQNFAGNSILIECRADKGLIVANTDKATTFNDLGCASAVKEDILVQPDWKCYYKQNLNISIEFNSDAGSFPLITVCHDNTTYNSLVTRHTLRGSSTEVAQISNTRPGFKKAQFYGRGVSPDESYKQKNQLTMVESLVKSKSLANKYIDPSQSYFFARGHLAPDRDFINVYEQNATYYFVNVIPQWQSINNGNWKALENAARNLGAKKKAPLDIYTGGYETLALKDKDGVPVKIYLARSPDTDELIIPVPRLTWKVVHDPSENSAVAIIMVNNPHELSVTSEDIVCSSICDKISWVTWDIHDVSKGYTYCCTVGSFRKAVPYMPSLGRVKALTA